jgi:hypothetical protein
MQAGHSNRLLLGSVGRNLAKFSVKNEMHDAIEALYDILRVGRDSDEKGRLMPNFNSI